MWSIIEYKLNERASKKLGQKVYTVVRGKVLDTLPQANDYIKKLYLNNETSLVDIDYFYDTMIAIDISTGGARLFKLDSEHDKQARALFRTFRDYVYSDLILKEWL